MIDEEQEALEILTSAIKRLNDAVHTLARNGIQVEYEFYVQQQVGYFDLKTLKATVKKVLRKI